MSIAPELLLANLERMASYGTAPENGCSSFGVGYEEAFSTLKDIYISSQGPISARFDRGESSWKLIVGPFGSGKTHFIRQLMEIAREQNCATAEIALNKQLSFTDTLSVYSEVVRELRVPGLGLRGILPLLRKSVSELSASYASSPHRDDLVAAWIGAITELSFPHSGFAKVAARAMAALVREDARTLDMCQRWLEGDVCDSTLAKELEVRKIERGETAREGVRMMLSLFPLIRHCGYRGTVVCFDEAEQGLTVAKSKMAAVLSGLMSSIEAITNAEGASAMVVYAVTPDLRDQLMKFPALQSRLDGHDGQTFLDGNHYSPIIDLRSGASADQLLAIGSRLLTVCSDALPGPWTAERPELEARMVELALSISEDNASSGSRRTMAQAASRVIIEALRG